MIEHGPTRIESLTLENYRLFDSLHIEFHPELTVFVASNGGGKTAVLDAIATTLRPLVDILDGYGRPRQTKVALTNVRRVLDPTGRMQLVPPMNITTRMLFDGVEQESVASIHDERGRAPKNVPGALDQAANLRHAIIDRAQNHELPPIDLPLLAYYGTGRLWNHPERAISRRRTKEPDLTPNSPLRGYTDCLESASHYTQFADAFSRIWLTAQGLTHLPLELRKMVSVEQLKAIEDAVGAIIGPTTDWPHLTWDPEERSLAAVSRSGASLPVDLLSDGIRTMIGLVGDLAYRASLMNPHHGVNACRRVRGLVLIDEVDMHLHPEWQQLVLPSLREAFPRVQFIVTTHSPQVISTVRRECIRILTRHDGKWYATMPDQSPLGRSSADALARVQSVDPVPPIPIQEELRVYEQLVTGGRENEAETQTLARKLRDAGVEVPEADLAMWRFLGSRKRAGR